MSVLLVIVNDRYILRPGGSFPPFETDPPLVVDADAVLTLSIALQRFEAIPGPIVISRTMAERLWPETKRVGGRVRFGREEPWKTVVGVVSDLGRRGLDASQYLMDYYESAAQNEWRGAMVLIARAGGDPEALVPPHPR